ncbi:MAG: DUF87 domain-containing protein [Chloroflexota bacterium]
MPFIEAPTTFYLGRRYDPTTHRLVDEVVYYDSRDLTTHAIVVGMTGSGKTGLCIDILEEAVLDNIPAIIIDPKGDITNLLLTFPNLRPEDFAPWINEDDAQRAGLSEDEYARDVAQQWRDGLTSWSIVPPRIAAMKNAAQFSIYTPGSDAGLPVSILDSLRAPREGWVGFEEAHRERIRGVVTALLALIGRQVDPVKDREHVLLSNLFENAWKTGHNLTLEDIILQVQKPPISKLGVFDIDTFFPEKDRFKLAMELNNIIAAPSFQSWITGEPMDISHLLYTAEGRPRVSIFYIAHLTEAERTFMITLLLENMLAWMRTLSGTSSLRAILYFDEMFGYFPPAPRNPPTKEPLLRLLKQARAFGIGLILATQNPGDLDYKGLSNAGTWIIGKLQTENDKNRVLGGLQAAATAQNNLNIDNLNKLLSSLDPRVFVLHNIHDEGGPVLVHSRWSMSYLRGPLTRVQVRQLMEPQRRALGLNTPAPGVAGGRPIPAAQAPAVATYATSAPPAQIAPPPPVQAVPPPVKPAVPAPKAKVPPPPPSSVPPSSNMPPPPPDLPELSGAAPAPFVSPLIPDVAYDSEPPQSLPPDPYSTDAQAAPYTTPFGTPPEGVAASRPPEPPMPVSYAIPNDPDLPSGDPSVPADQQNISVANSNWAQPAVLASSQAVSQPLMTGGLTQQGPSLPEGYSTKPVALLSSVAQFYIPTLISTQQAIREWEKKFNYDAASFGGSQLLYRPVLLAQVAVRYLDRKSNVEEDQRWAFHIPNLDKASLVRWGEFQTTPLDPNQVSSEPFGDAFYGTLPPGLTDTKRMTALKADVVDYVYRSATLNLFYNSTLDIYGNPRDNRRDFLIKIQQKAREARDAEIDDTTKKYDAQLEKLDEKLRKELRDLNYDKQNLDSLKREDLYTTGEAVLGLLKGRTSFTLSRMSRTRRYKNAAQERAVAGEQQLADLESQIDRKQQELQSALKDVNDKWSKVASTVDEHKLTPTKKDIVLEIYGIGWLPTWYMVLNGQSVMLPAYAGSRISAD